MGYPTPIEWTDATWNPIGGCSIKSPGCKPCYAQQLAGTRLSSHPLYSGTTDLVKGKPVFNGHLTTAPHDHPVWKWPLTWRGAKQPKLGQGRPSMIFVGDMSDLFHEDRPDEVIDRVFAVMALCPQHVFQVLTKRASRMRAYFSPGRSFGVGMRAFNATSFNIAWPLPNVWLGVSAERQQEADERVPDLLATPAAVRFVSYEPALGPIDFTRIGQRIDGGDIEYIDSLRGTTMGGSIAEKARPELRTPHLDQIIAGGTSGQQATPAHPDWFRKARDDCSAAGVSFFFKQWGEWAPIEADRSDPNGHYETRLVAPDGKQIPGSDIGACDFPNAARLLYRVGRKRAGRILDGIEHNGFPA